MIYQGVIGRCASALLLAFALASANAQQAPASTPAPAAAAQQTEPTVSAQPQAGAPAPAPAVATPAYPPPAAPATASLLKTILALCFVLALLFGLAWAAKRYGPKATAGSANLRIVGALNLGGRERILLVEVADQWIVVGAAPGRVNLLSTMPKQEGAAPLPGVAANVPSGFADWLKQTIEKRNAK
jgi:flagellar protein FliO/FliZ